MVSASRPGLALLPCGCEHNTLFVSDKFVPIGTSPYPSNQTELQHGAPAIVLWSTETSAILSYDHMTPVGRNPFCLNVIKLLLMLIRLDSPCEPGGLRVSYPSM